MKAPDARQSSLIHECGCDPDRYLVVSEKNGWIHARDKFTHSIAYFDLDRKMICYSEDIFMYYRQASHGCRYILTKRGELSLSEVIRDGAVQGQSIKGRENSVPVKWWKDKYVIEENENDHEEKTRGISQH